MMLDILDSPIAILGIIMLHNLWNHVALTIIYIKHCLVDVKNQRKSKINTKTFASFILIVHYWSLFNYLFERG
ncbi:unnamed protein product [Adineta ricciae]|uniref:Uncharacterized protein n=1 Tax=Adineta ricciae TaxID=249248 RepID=A0A813Y7C2_ADIRI|nr:unnamed protein product [Adineta ricciae]